MRFLTRLGSACYVTPPSRTKTQPEADFLVKNSMFICLKTRLFFRRWGIFIQINMPFCTKTECLSICSYAFSIEDAHLHTFKHAVLHQKIRLWISDDCAWNLTREPPYTYLLPPGSMDQCHAPLQS